MASTSTNKQPLMQDRVFHNIVDCTNATIGENQVVTVGGSNSAALLLDCTQNDGAVIAELYSIGRATLIDPDDDGDNSDDQEPYIVCVYLSTANDFLRDSQARFVTAWVSGGTFDTGRTQEGEKVVATNLPYLLAPVPGVGSEDPDTAIGTQFQGLYVPKGKALWCAVQKQTPTDTAVRAPLVGAQGGFF